MVCAVDLVLVVMAAEISESRPATAMTLLWLAASTAWLVLLL